MKILVTGYTGQLGYDVVQEGLRHGLEIAGVGSNNLDITNQKDVFLYVNKFKPDAIVHCAAYTAVDQAEDDRNQCYDVNVNGTRYLVTAAHNIKAKFLYVSTDYVFNGEGNEPFKESDTPNPIGYYGRTKFEGEEIVKSMLAEWFIVRISWVFGINGNNFVKTMLRLAETRNEINVVGDQIGSPTYTVDLAKLLINMVQSEKYGIYHASNEGYCSWYQFAQKIFRFTNRDIKINLISTEDYPTKAVRPKNSRMSKQKLIENGFNLLPTWQDALNRYLKELSQEVN